MYSPSNHRDKSPISPIISQLMRKDREINCLRQDLSSFQLNNQENIIRIQLLEQEIFSRDQYIVELQNSVKCRTPQQEMVNINYDYSDYREITLQSSIQKHHTKEQSKENRQDLQNLQEIQQIANGLKIENTKLLIISNKYKKLKLQSKKFKQGELQLQQLRIQLNQNQNQVDQYQGLMQQFNLAQAQIQNLKKQLEYVDSKRNKSEEINPINLNISLDKQQIQYTHVRANSIQIPNLLKAQIQSLPSIIEARPLSNIVLVKEIISPIITEEQSISVEILQTLLKESLEREHKMSNLLNQVVEKCADQNHEILIQSQRLEQTIEISQNDFEQKLIQCHDEIVFYKQKCLILEELFDHLRAFNVDNQSQKQFAIFLKQYVQQQSGFYDELQNIFMVISQIELKPKLLNDCSDMQIEFIKNVEKKLLDQSINIGNQNKENNNFTIDSLRQLMNLCIKNPKDNYQESSDMIEQVRKIIQQNNRHDLERQQWDQENFELNKQISRLKNNLNNTAQQIREVPDNDTRRSNQQHALNDKEFQLTQTINQKQMRVDNSHDIIRELQQKNKILQNSNLKINQNLEILNKTLTQYKTRVCELEQDLISHQKELNNLQNQRVHQKDTYESMQKQARDINNKIDIVRGENEEEIGRITQNFELKLNNQEQYYLSLFENMQYSIKQKQKLINQHQSSHDISTNDYQIDPGQQKTRSTSYYSHNSQNESHKSTKELEEHYQKKFKSNYRRKLKDFESILEYIFELSQGYDAQNQKYQSNHKAKNPRIFKILSDVNIIFQQNPELQQFVQKIENNIRQDDCIRTIKQII